MKKSLPCLEGEAGFFAGGLKRLLLFAFAIMMVAPAMAATQATFDTNRTDFRDESIYFVMTTRFYDGDESNNTQCWDNQVANANDPPWRGDFKGLIEKLDYIKALGFTAVWITPVVENASGYDYHGYHASNFSKVDARYLSEDVDFQSLINAAHAKGMKIILDIVLQHTGNFGEENLCKLFTRDWTADQSNIDACMVPYTQSQGGVLEDNYASLPSGSQYSARLSKMKNTTGVNYDSHNYWHHFANFNWDNSTRWFGQIAGDCVDLNTEHPTVYNYLIECYTKFIAMGVDGFRIDTSGHIPRLTFNKAFIPAFHEAAETYKEKRNGFPFYMFGEVCARYSSIWYREQPCLSPCYYTWAESKEYAWDTTESSWDNIVAMEGDNCNTHTNHKSVWDSGEDDESNISSQPSSTNAFLDGNNYHTPDYSKSSGFNVIDFTMHHNFSSIGSGWGVAQPGNDKYYNDATYNVVYVDSHDYAPNGAPENQRFAQGTDAWASNLSLMFTHRGVPCVYYGSEIEFRKGYPIDNGTNSALKETGRAYFGGYITGSATVSDFAEYTGASGNMGATLGAPLAVHMQQLNKIRQAVPALRKGQYSMDGCDGSYAFKRRYTDSTTDSYALVTIQGNATFTNVLNGTYQEVVTGETKTVSNGTLVANCPSNAGNLRVWVLNTSLTSAPGKVVSDGNFIYASSSAGIGSPSWDGTQEGGSDPTPTPTPSVDPYTPTMNDGEWAVFFEAASGDYSTVATWVWNNSTNYTGGSWPGQAATMMGSADNGNIIWKWTYSGTPDASNPPTSVIFNNGGSGKQTADLAWHNGGYYTINGYQRTIGGGSDPEPEPEPDPTEPYTPAYNEGEWAVFFEATESDFSSVNVWVWNNSSNFSGGSWPGQAATKMGLADNGNNIWKWKYIGTPNESNPPSNIIFNNPSTTKQTADLVWQNGGYYTFDGLQKTIKAGIDDVEEVSAVVYSNEKTIYIANADDALIKVYDLGGAELYSGYETAIPVSQPGLYIVSIGGQVTKIGVK